MDNFTFEPARRTQAKARLGLIGPSGSGKTIGALLIAAGMREAGLVDKVAMIDTEGRSGNLYEGILPYDICPLSAPFSPIRYVTAIQSAVNLEYDLIIIDGISPAWNREGGVLSIVDKAQSSQKNQFGAWKDATPQHNALFDTIEECPAHIITTFWAKTEYVVETTETGRTKVRKLGLGPDQRTNVEYRFTTLFNISDDHIAEVSKDRTGIFEGESFQISEDTGKRLSSWLVSDSDEHLKRMSEEVSALESMDALNDWYFSFEQDIKTFLTDPHRKEIIKLCSDKKGAFNDSESD